MTEHDEMRQAIRDLQLENLALQSTVEALVAALSKAVPGFSGELAETAEAVRSMGPDEYAPALAVVADHMQSFAEAAHA